LKIGYNNIVQSKAITKPSKFVTTLKLKTETINPNIIVMDIESALDSEGNHVPCAIGIYGLKVASQLFEPMIYYLSDYNSPEDMIDNALKTLLIKDLHNQSIFFIISVNMILDLFYLD
jgi:hypothetical protein